MPLNPAVLADIHKYSDVNLVRWHISVTCVPPHYFFILSFMHEDCSICSFFFFYFCLGRVSEESLEFFERMNAVLQKQENMMRAAQVEVTSTQLQPFHLLNIWNMHGLRSEQASEIPFQPTSVAAVTSVDRRTGLKRVLGGAGAQLWQAAVGGYVQPMCCQKWHFMTSHQFAAYQDRRITEKISVSMQHAKNHLKNQVFYCSFESSCGGETRLRFRRNCYAYSQEITQ